MQILVALLIFSLIVVIHELGHFLLAKRGGIAVTEFSLGMGPRILSKQIGETRYSWKLLPLGGSCMMVGEDEDSDDENAFGKKSVWTRISVVAAGPVFNFILAFVLSLIIVAGVGYDAPVLPYVAEDGAAAAAGLQVGDRILKVDDRKITLYRELPLYLNMHAGDSITLEYERDGEVYTQEIPLRQDETGKKYLGISASTYRTKGNVLETIYYSAYEVKYWICTTIESLGMLFGGGVKAEDLAGPVGIVNMIGDTYEEAKQDGAFMIWMNMLNISILLSANLGVMNLLPIPALDGGRLVFLFIEAIRKKAIDPEKEGMVHFAGFVVLMAFMLFVMFNDVRNIFF